MSLRIRQIVLDASDIEAVATFWSALLGWPITFRSADWITISGESIDLAVQRVTNHVEPRWPQPERPQQVHLDLPVPDLDESERLILQLGGEKLADRPDEDPPFRVFADPAGHSFCLEDANEGMTVGDRLDLPCAE